MRRTRGAQSLFAACVLALAVAAVSGGEVPSVLSTGRVDVAVNPLDDARTGATPPANRSEASRDASAGRGTPARLWDDVVRQATAGSWRDDWFWITSFRPVSDAAAKPALEMATFAPLANGGFRWVCVFYERWELDGDSAAARPETPMTRRSLKTRCWHKGSAGEFKFLGPAAPRRQAGRRPRQLRPGRRAGHGPAGDDDRPRRTRRARRASRLERRTRRRLPARLTRRRSSFTAVGAGSSLDASPPPCRAGRAARAGRASFPSCAIGAIRPEELRP